MMKTLVPGLGTPGAGIYTGAQQLKSTFQTQYQTMSQQAETAMAAYEAQYCTPAKFTPSVKKPAQFTGHGFEISFSTGSCIFNETKFLGGWVGGWGWGVAESCVDRPPREV